MPKVVRVGVDSCGGGTILGGGNSSVFLNGSLVAVVGDSVAPHPCCGQEGCDPH